MTTRTKRFFSAYDQFADNVTNLWLHRKENRKLRAEKRKAAERDYRPAQWRFINVFAYYIIIITGNGLFVMLVPWLMTFIVSILTGVEINLSWTILGSLFLLGAGLAWPRNGKTFTVPNAHVAVLTILGRRFDIFLLEGDYPEPEIGSIIGRSKANKQGFTTDGFVNMGKLPFQIWNDRVSKDTLLENIARNGATLFANLLIEVQVYNPRLILNSEDPLLSLAERARTAFRTAISFFTDRDNAKVKTILVRLMMGKTIITAFINNKTARNFEQGSIIRDRSGQAMQITLEDNSDGDDEYSARVEKAKTAFSVDVVENADEHMIGLLPKKGDKIQVVSKTVDQSIDEVLRSIGCDLIQASVSNVTFDPRVQDKAGLASSEAFEAKIVEDSAQSQAEGEKILAEGRTNTEGKPLDELDRVLIAAQDNPNININHVSGSGGDASKGASVIAEALRKDK